MAFFLSVTFLTAGERKIKVNEVLNFDEIPPLILDHIYLENDEKIIPLSGNFKMVSFAPMSNRKGDRWALVSIRNMSSGVRIFTQEHIVATFADGTRKFAKKIEMTLKAKEFFSESIEFGNSKFPIVMVETNLKE